MFVTSRAELAPTEDQSILFFQAVAPRTASLEWRAYTRRSSVRREGPEITRASCVLIRWRCANGVRRLEQLAKVMEQGHEGA